MASVSELVESNNCRILELTLTIPGAAPLKEINHSLLNACNKGLYECVRILIEYGKASASTCNASGMTCLMNAAQNGYEQIVEYLIDNGANVNARSISGASALSLSAQYGHLVCLNLILEAGGDVNSIDNGGSTPLIAAAKNCRYTLDVIERLVEVKKCRINLQNNIGRTALHYVVNQADLISWCGCLLTAGADPDLQDHEGNTPFMLAATEGFDEVMKCLIAFHCNPDIPNKYGKSPIHFLAQKNHYQIINFMSKLHCDFDPVDSYGNIPLFYAVTHNRPEAVKALLRANCKLNPPPTSNGKIPFVVALEKKLWGIAKLLILAGCDISPLYPWLEQIQREQAARQRERLTLFEEQLEEEEIDEELNEALNWFTDWIHQPHTLQQLTRIRIRGLIKGKTIEKGRELPVPVAIQDYITLKEVHDHHIDSYLI